MKKEDKRYQWDDAEVTIIEEQWTDYGYEVTFIEDRRKQIMVFASEEEAHEYFR